MSMGACIQVASVSLFCSELLFEKSAQVRDDLGIKGPFNEHLENVSLILQVRHLRELLIMEKLAEVISVLLNKDEAPTVYVFLTL